MTSLQSAARMLGGKVTKRDTIQCPGAGHSSHDDSLVVTFDPASPDGFTTHSHAGDDWQSCKDYVRQVLGLSAFQPAKGFKKAPTYLVPAVAASNEPDHQAVKHIDFAAALWSEAMPIGGTMVETYLQSRCINAPGLTYLGHALRFHPACPFKLDSGEVVRLPAMIGAMTAIDGGTFQGVHRTALQPDGSGKAKVRGLKNVKAMLGAARGAVIRLAPDEEITSGLCLVEGIETGLAVQDLGFTNTWCCMTAGTLSRFPVLPGIDCLNIFADHDPERVLPNGKVVRPGADAAIECANRWNATGRECAVWMPPLVGTDFNDILQERMAA